MKFRQTHFLISILLMSVLNIAAMADTPIDTATTAAQVIDHYISAIGGRAVLEGKETLTCRGRIITDLTSRESPYFEIRGFEAMATASGAYRINYDRSGGLEKRGFDGTVGWARNECGVEETDNPLDTKLAFFLNPQGAVRLEQYFPGLTFSGVEKIKGRPAYVLTPANLDPAHFNLYFDVESGLLVRIGYYWSVEEYIESDGIVRPTRIVASRKGGSTTTIFESVEYNVDLEPTLFSKPD